MHELSIAQNIVEIVQDALGRAGRPRVEKVVVQLGEMVAVVPRSLEFCYEAMTQGTPLAGSTLVIEEVPAEARCRACGRRFRVDSYVFRCPHCEATQLEVLTGHELAVSHIEVEE